MERDRKNGTVHSPSAPVAASPAATAATATAITADPVVPAVGRSFGRYLVCGGRSGAAPAPAAGRSMGWCHRSRVPTYTAADSAPFTSTAAAAAATVAAATATAAAAGFQIRCCGNRTPNQPPPGPATAVSIPPAAAPVAASIDTFQVCCTSPAPTAASAAAP